MRARWYAIATVAALLLAPVQANAAPPDEAVDAEPASDTAPTSATAPTMGPATTEAFERGLAQFDAGEYGRAVSAWKEALGLAAADGPVIEARMMLNVSTAYEKLYDEGKDPVSRDSALEYLGRYETALETAYASAPELAAQERQRVADRRKRLEDKADTGGQEGLSTIFDTPAESDPAAAAPQSSAATATTPEGPAVAENAEYTKGKRLVTVGGVFSGIAILNVVATGVMSGIQLGGADLLGPILGTASVGLVTATVGLILISVGRKKMKRAGAPKITAAPTFSRQFAGFSTSVKF